MHGLNSHARHTPVPSQTMPDTGPSRKRKRNGRLAGCAVGLTLRWGYWRGRTRGTRHYDHMTWRCDLALTTGGLGTRVVLSVQSYGIREHSESRRQHFARGLEPPTNHALATQLLKSAALQPQPPKSPIQASMISPDPLSQTPRALDLLMHSGLIPFIPCSHTLPTYPQGCAAMTLLAAAATTPVPVSCFPSLSPAALGGPTPPMQNTRVRHTPTSAVCRMSHPPAYNPPSNVPYPVSTAPSLPCHSSHTSLKQ